MTILAKGNNFSFVKKWNSMSQEGRKVIILTIFSALKIVDELEAYTFVFSYENSIYQYNNCISNSNDQ